MSGCLRAGGSFADEKICKGCPHRYEREESFLTLSVDIRNHTNLHDALAEYVKGDLLEGPNAYLCERCQKKVSYSAYEEATSTSTSTSTSTFTCTSTPTCTFTSASYEYANEYSVSDPRAARIAHVLLLPMHVLGARHPTPLSSRETSALHNARPGSAQQPGPLGVSFSVIRCDCTLIKERPFILCSVCLGGRGQTSLGEASAADARHPAQALRLRLGARVLHQVSRLLRVPAPPRHEAVHARRTRRDRRYYVMS